MSGQKRTGVCRAVLSFIWRRRTIAATLVCCLTCLLLLAGPGFALDPNKRLSQYLHTSWRLQDGSAPSGMYTIAQTSDGFLWFLSSRGDVYRFDGIQFLPWHRPAGAGSIGRIRNMVGDQDGVLWALGANGIVRLKGGIVTSHFELKGLMPNAGNVSKDTDGSLWVVRGENGSSEPVCHVTEHAAKCFGKSDGIPIAPIDAILADGSGGFWLGGQAALVHWHAGVSETYPIQGLKSNTGAPGILSLARGRDGSIWVGVLSAGPGQGLARLEKGAVRSFVTRGFDGSKFGVFALRFDRDDNLWVGTNDAGVFRVHGNAADHYTRMGGLSSDFVRSFFEDREGTVWAVTSNGVDNFHDPRIATYSTAEGLAKDWAVGVLASKDGTVWVANADSLDHIAKDGTISSIRTGHGLPGSQVSSLLEDRAGNLWVGVDDGLYIFKDGRFRRLPERKHQPLGLVFELIEDMDGNIWAECAGTGNLVRIRDFQVREEFSRSQIPTGRLAPDPRKGIWIGTRNGELVLFRDGDLKKFPVGSKASPWANQIITESDGDVLAAFDDGLVELRQGKTQRMTTKNGLPCDGVISFVKDKEKRWWLNTQCGIVEFSDSELQRWSANPEVVIQTRFYDTLDGARPSSRPPFRSAASSPDGRVWFVNSGVVQMVDPSSLSQEALPVETYIESVVVDRKQFTARDGLKLSPHPHDLQIDYTSPTFTMPRKVKFRYRLDGFDRDWHEVGTRRQAFYTDLPPRNYSFRVVACNSDGIWNNTEAKLDFSIAPAYYQTNWFRASAVAAFFVGLWGLYRLRLHQIAREFNAHLEGQVDERLRVARDLHDTLLQSFQGLMPVFQTARNLLPLRADRAAEVLDEGLHDAANAIVEGRDAIQNLRAKPSGDPDLGSLLSAAGNELAQSPEAEGSAPAFRVVVEGSRLPLVPLLRDEIYRIGCELLRNAFRHAHAGRIEAEIRYDRDMFRLRIRDDGKGIDSIILKEGARREHFGLPGMHERAQSMGGRLTIWSEPGAGTEAELTVPARIAYEKFSTSNGWRARLGRRLRLTAPNKGA